ncbi:MAG TPA: glycosyltransferase family 39 protein [Candidatus Rubrimentiphilum sp.]|nr:glycosyltransferase family 39 protein [Candidatus Rubrimentiphilum sp.]
MNRLPRAALLIVAGMAAFRIAVASHIPLTEDESYYWAWSRHLALGYVDHPPMVAWLIALTAPFGSSELVIRLPFIACEALAAIALGRTAIVLTGNARAGGAAAVIFALIPQTRMIIGEALPDGPYLLFWSLALLFAARAASRLRTADMIFLGIALGGALLSRAFGFSLLAGVLVFSLLPAQRRMWKLGFWIAPVIAVVLYMPFVYWNATHGWVNYNFTVYREAYERFSPAHLLVLSTLRFALEAAAFFIATYLLTIRRRYDLLACTALPLPLLLIVLSFSEGVESYWLLGPFASLCVALGIAYANFPALWKRLAAAAWIVPAAYAMLVVTLLSLPQPVQASLLRASNQKPKSMFYSAVYAYAPLARDVRGLLKNSNAIVMTDKFEIAAELLYQGNIESTVVSGIGRKQWAMWQGGSGPARYLVVLNEAPGRDPAAMRPVAKECSAIHDGPTLRYAFAGPPVTMFYTKWCDR